VLDKEKIMSPPNYGAFHISSCRIFLWKSVIHHLYKMKSYDFHPHNFHHYSSFTQVGGGLARFFFDDQYGNVNQKRIKLYLKSHYYFHSQRFLKMFNQMFFTITVLMFHEYLVKSIWEKECDFRKQFT
jgi:hypothetical protein